MKNAVSLIGNIGKDAQVREFESGKAVISFSLATSKSYKNAQGEKNTDTTWHDCEVWSKKGKTGLAEFLLAGKLVSVDGSIRHGSYEKEVGSETVSIPTTTIIVDDVLLLSKKDSE